MSKDYYVSEIENINQDIKIIDYVSLLRDEGFVSTVFSYGANTKQIVIALDEKEDLIFVDISFMGKFKLLGDNPKCKISKMENNKKLQIDNYPQLNGVYTVKGKLKSGKYNKEEFINIILNRYGDE